MKRILLLLLAATLVVSLSACAKKSELICDSCGVSFVGDDDYSKQLKEDAEIQEALGIDLYSFYCPDCRNEHSATALAVHLLSTEDAARVIAYRNGESVSSTNDIDDSITILDFTGMEPYYTAMDNLSGLYGIYDVDAKDWKATPVFSTIYTYDDEGMALAEKESYYGYIDQSGNTAIGFQFVDALPFNESGLALVKMNQIGVIDRIGNFVIDPMYERITFRDNFIQVYDGRYFGLYNFGGDMIISPTYENEFVFEGDYIYTLKVNRWYEVFDHNGNSLLGSLKGVMKKDAALSSKIGEKERVEGVSLPVKNIFICHYSDSTTQHTYFRLFNTEFKLLQEQDYVYISPFNSLGYAAAVPCEFTKNSYGNLGMTDSGDWIVINQDGSYYKDLPDMSGLYRGGDSFHSYKYLYANDYFAYAQWNGETLVNISTGEVTRWKTVNPIDGTQCIIAQDLGTNLWSLFDQDTLVDSNCTEISYDSDSNSFSLIHGGESQTYKPIET